MGKYFIEGNNTFYLSYIGWEKRVIQIKKRFSEGKNILQRKWGRIFWCYVIDGYTWFHNLGGLDVFYLSDIPFEQIDYGYKTECIIGMIFLLGALLS